MARDYDFTVDTKGFKTKMKKLQADFPTFIKTILGKLGMRLLTKVRNLTPFDTHLLERSWFLSPPKISKDESSIELKNNVKYALAVEKGHVAKRGAKSIGPGRFVPGRFMLRKGFEELNSQAPQILESEIQKFINSHGGGR